MAVYIDNGKQKYSVPRMKYITCLRKVTEHYWNICKHCLTNMKGTTVYPKKYAHGICFAVLCCGYTLTDFPIFIRLTSLALWQSNDFPSASKATLMNMDTYFMWIHYERLHNHNNAKPNKTVCIFLGIYWKNSFWFQNVNRDTGNQQLFANCSFEYLSIFGKNGNGYTT